MLSIRLSRGGTKKRPFYRIVIAEKSSPRDGRFVECVGTSNPLARGLATSLTVDMDRYNYWFGQGARPSDTVKRLIKKYKNKPVSNNHSSQP